MTVKTLLVTCPRCRRHVPGDLIAGITGYRAEVTHRCPGLTQGEVERMEIEVMDRGTVPWGFAAGMEL